jgi:hypothetical protein
LQKTLGVKFGIKRFFLQSRKQPAKRTARGVQFKTDERWAGANNDSAPLCHTAVGYLQRILANAQNRFRMFDRFAHLVLPIVDTITRLLTVSSAVAAAHMIADGTARLGRWHGCAHARIACRFTTRVHTRRHTVVIGD